MSAVIETSLGRPLEDHERKLLSATGTFRWGDPGTDAWCSDFGGGVMDTREALEQAADLVAEGCA